MSECGNASISLLLALQTMMYSSNDAIRKFIRTSLIFVLKEQEGGDDGVPHRQVTGSGGKGIHLFDVSNSIWFNLAATDVII